MYGDILEKASIVSEDKIFTPGHCLSQDSDGGSNPPGDTINQEG
jgi:hypothetical protein